MITKCETLESISQENRTPHSHKNDKGRAIKQKQGILQLQMHISEICLLILYICMSLHPVKVKESHKKKESPFIILFQCKKTHGIIVKRTQNCRTSRLMRLLFLCILHDKVTSKLQNAQTFPFVFHKKFQQTLKVRRNAQKFQQIIWLFRSGGVILRMITP